MKPRFLLSSLLAVTGFLAGAAPAAAQSTRISLAPLEARCARMLAAQQAIHEQTIYLDQRLAGGQTLRPGDRRALERLLALESAVILEADRAIAWLEGEGSAVAFPEVFRQVRDDMQAIRLRLDKRDVSPATQAIQRDVVETLREMVHALTKVHSCR